MQACYAFPQEADRFGPPSGSPAGGAWGSQAPSQQQGQPDIEGEGDAPPAAPRQGFGDVGDEPNPPSQSEHVPEDASGDKKFTGTVSRTVEGEGVVQGTATASKPFGA